MNPPFNHGSFTGEISRTGVRLNIRSKLLFVLWLIGIVVTVVGSLLPGKEAVVISLSDKLVHSAVYCFLATLAVLSVRPVKSGLILGLSMVILGFLLEIGQMYAPGRFFEFADIAANSAGAMLGIGFSFLTLKILERHHADSPG